MYCIYIFSSSNVFENGCIYMYISTWIFEKVAPEDLPERHRKPGFMTPNSLQNIRERKEKGGERGEKKKGLLALIVFILLATHRLRHLNQAVPFSKIRVDVGMK